MTQLKNIRGIDMKPGQELHAQAKKPSHRLAGISSMVGTTIEWYDFFIYGAAAALIFLINSSFLI